MKFLTYIFIYLGRNYTRGEIMASVTQSTYTDGRTYADIMAQLQSMGLKTTKINQGREADFEDYGNALSSDVKHMLMDSFDCDQDYILQNQIAGIFKNRHDAQFKDFVAACKSMGLSISRESVKTSYISDYKGGNFSNSVRNGSISVYTISDGKGGEIKIADTNGNGAIEVEELFMNQILGDLNMELTPVQGVSSSSYSGTLSAMEGEDNQKSNQEDYNRKVEEYLKTGSTKPEAELQASIDLDVYSFNYTGTMKSKAEEESQTDYNKMIEDWMELHNSSSEEAEVYVNADLGVSTFHYTGSKEDPKKDKNDKVKDDINDNSKLLNDKTAQVKNKVQTADDVDSNKLVNIFNRNLTSDLITSSNILTRVKNELGNSKNASEILQQTAELQIITKELEELELQDNIFAK